MTSEVESIKQRLLNAFPGISMSEDHVYTIEGDNRELTPVSSVIKRLTPDFNEVKWATLVAVKNNCSPEDILERWKEKRERACRNGTMVHAFAERYYHDRSLVPSNQYENAISMVYDMMGDRYIPVASELMMYSKKYNIAGTADLILYDSKMKSYIVVDYKTNESLHKKAYEKMYEPFDDLNDVPLDKYRLQLSLYKLMLEEAGFDVRGQCVMHLSMNGIPTAYWFECFVRRLINWLDGTDLVCEQES